MIACTLHTNVVSPPPSSSSTSASAREMPMPLPRRRAPPAPLEHSSSFPISTSNANNHVNAPIPKKKISIERSSSPLQQTQNKSKLLLENPVAAASEQPQRQNFPMPKPKPRPDRKSLESISSQTAHVIEPQTNRASTSSVLAEMKSSQSTDSNPGRKLKSDTNLTAEEEQQPVLSGQLRNPLAKYGVKVLPDNVLKERAERLKKADSSADSDLTFPQPAPPSNNAKTASSSQQEFSNAQRNPRKIPVQKASTSSTPSMDEFSDTGSITNFTKNHNVSTGSIGRSGIASKPAPALSKSDYTSQGSVRSIKQLTSAVASISPAESANYSDDGSREGYDSDNLEENLDFFEPARQSRRNNIGKVGRESSLTKSASASFPQRTTTTRGSASNQTSIGRQNEKEMLKSAGSKPRVFSSVSACDDDHDEGRNLIKSPGTVSESGFAESSSRRGQDGKKEEEDESNAKLNRWQNMVSLNEIEGGNRKNNQVIQRIGGPMPSNRKDSQSNKMPLVTPSATTNKSNVSTRLVLSGATSNKQSLLLQGDYSQRTKVHLAGAFYYHHTSS